MAEFTRTIVSRLRQYVGDRRHSKRQRVRLKLSLSLISATKGLNGARRINWMDGHTLDLSSNGLALVVPRITLGEHHLVGENRGLNLKLQLPDGPVEMQATPVRYERLEDDQSETGYVIAAKIVRMSDDDRARYSAYVATLRENKELSPN
jgi:PilZ domain